MSARDSVHTLAPEDWNRLARHQGEPSVTLVLPLRRRDGDRTAVRIRLRHLVARAERELEALGCPPERIREILDPIRPPRDAVELPRDGDTLVAFLSPSVQEVHRVAAELDDRVVVSDHFALAELWEVLDQPASWYVLGLADDGARLIHVADGNPREVDLPLERPDRAAANAERVEPLEGRPLHANRFHSPPSAGQPAAHPQGFGYEQVDDIERDNWYRVVDAALWEALGDRRDPIVLVADVRHHGPFRQVCQHPGLLPDGVKHDPHLPVADLCNLARPVVADRAFPDPEAIADRWHAAARIGLTGTDPVQALEAAAMGRIDTVYWVPRRHLPPGADADRSAAVIDDVVRQVAVHGGEVVPLPPEALPDRADGRILNVVYRW